MEYREIVSVTGLGGLYQLITTKSDGAIVRNIADNSTKFISARVHNVTPLDSIEVYTVSDNVRLQEIFKLMKDADEEVLDPKGAGNDDIRSYFKTVVPEMDEDRVYVSDMKKILKWYTLLNNHDLLVFEEEEEDAAAKDENTETKEQEEQPKKKAATKKKATKKDNEEKPAKKTATKKKAAKADDKEKPATKKATAKKKKTEE